MKEKKAQVAVIGAGTAGLSAFKEASKVAKKCLLINGGPYGTTCARVGCMPSKILIQIANDFYRRQIFGQEGIVHGNHLDIDTAKVMRYLRKHRDHFVSGVIETIKQIGDRNISGYARFLEPNVLEVKGERIIADSIVIATGSTPIVPEAWKEYGRKVITTDEIFEERSIENQMGVIGGGVVGLELGQALSRMGVSVKIIEGKGFIGGLSDPVVNRYAIAVLGKEFSLYTKAKAEIACKKGRLKLSCDDKNFTIKKALVCVGRKPNIDHLGLEKIGIKLNEQGLPKVNFNTLKIKNASIYCAGDVNGHKPILHEAADEGRIAGYNAARLQPRCFRRRASLLITFTEPQIVIVGQRYRDIKKMPHIIGEANFEKQGRSRIMHKNKGILRVYAEPRRGRLLGAELIAPQGESIGHLLAWAIQKQLTAFEVLNMPFYHPTVLEGLKTAIRELASKVRTSAPELDLAPCGSLAMDCFN